MTQLTIPTEPVYVRDASPLAILDNAVKCGANVETLERISALAERWQANQAKEQFGRALAAFQAECPPIHKGREAQGGKMRFTYASLDDIEKVVKPIREKHGIAVTYDLRMVDGLMHATCRVRVGSYSEETVVPVPIPKEMVVGDTQKYGAATSYAKRYALCAALNITVTDEDNENNLPQKISQEQIDELNDLIDTCPAFDLDRFLAVYEIKAIADMTEAQFNDAVVKIKAKKARAAT